MCRGIAYQKEGGAISEHITTNTNFRCKAQKVSHLQSKCSLVLTVSVSGHCQPFTFHQNCTFRENRFFFGFGCTIQLVLKYRTSVIIDRVHDANVQMI